MDRWDRHDRFQIVPLSSDAGRQILTDHGLGPDDPISWIDPVDRTQITAFIVDFGCIAAPLWGAIFAAIYACFSRSTRQTPG